MFIKQETSNYINNLFDTYVDHKQSSDTKRMHPSVDEFSDVLQEINISQEDVYKIRIEETSNTFAVPIHADLPKGSTTTLLPLKFKPSVWTILFQSFYVGNNAGGCDYRPSNKKYYEDDELHTDIENITSITDNDFDQVQYEKYLSYMPKEDLYGLTISASIEWQENKIIQFPSNQLHSGSCFLDSKRWLRILSTTSY